MDKTSLIYSNVFSYRLLMLLLYKGRYFRRFKHISRLISGKNVTELCFGDTILAEHCKKQGIHWTGIDTNKNFVERAIKKGYDARCEDIQAIDSFPLADNIIISGSLYHFHNDLESLFKKILDASPRIIISEPVINLSNNKGIIGKLAKASANINGKEQHFRYTEYSLKEALNILSKKLNFNYEVIEQFDKDLIIVIKK